MFDKYIIDIMEVEQPIGKFYIGKIDGNILYGMAEADIREIKNGKDYLGIQRTLDKTRVKLINQYIKTIHSSFPNSIILNLGSKNLIKKENDKLHIRVTERTFSIIDGQHRLAGFEETCNERFELVVAIFIDLNIEEQSILFSTINSEQKRVDPSFKYDLESYSSIKTPRKVVRDIALAFNTDKDSPWYGNIKMIGKKDTLTQEPLITLKGFAEPILNIIYDDEKDMYSLRNELYEYKFNNNLEDNFNVSRAIDPESYDYDIDRYVFWEFYCTDREAVIYKILLNYFNGLKFLLKKDWGNNKSILNKTTGYNAIMKLFKDVYKDAYEKRDFSFEFFKERLKLIESLDGTLLSDEFGGSGEISTMKLYRKLLDILNIKNKYTEKKL